MAPRKQAPRKQAPKKTPAKPKAGAGKVPSDSLDVASIAQVTRVGSKWEIGTEWTPSRIANALRESVNGNAQDYLTLAIDIEERYAHYASALQTRKLGVIGKQLDILGGDKTKNAQTIAEAFKEQVAETECFHGLMLDMLDAIAKSYSVVQPVWNTKGKYWNYEEFKFLDQRMFKYDPETMTELRINDGSDSGVEFDPAEFIIHKPKIRSGLPIRGGLARAACVGYMFQSASVKNWAAFAEVYGMPLRIGKYDSDSAGPAEISKLRTAIVNLAFDAACVMPNDMSLEVLDARRPTSGDNVFEGMARFWDEQISKLVLGQTMTADNGSSEAQAKIHNEVRIDIARGDALSLASSLRNQVVAPWVRMNFGDSAPVPKLVFNVDPPEDLKEFALAISPLLSSGLRIRAQEIRDKFGLEEPAEGEEIITPWPTGTKPSGTPDSGTPSK